MYRQLIFVLLRRNCLSHCFVTLPDGFARVKPETAADPIAVPPHGLKASQEARAWGVRLGSPHGGKRATWLVWSASDKGGVPESPDGVSVAPNRSRSKSLILPRLENELAFLYFTSGDPDLYTSRASSFRSPVDSSTSVASAARLSENLSDFAKDRTHHFTASPDRACRNCRQRFTLVHHQWAHSGFRTTSARSMLCL